ncbi:hypothetical protein O6H91_18G044600 [Diphasiastrum complanatum]|uniref:Uncharacterized protein n=1 Tax=Diphasiastrum complanatum TaxID=34168 RepID=A0ACC2B0I3_DIPCM|nr:hypothetical protein O6H91_18G044600 [Diphasiastrum complanatum]
MGAEGDAVLVAKEKLNDAYERLLEDEVHCDLTFEVGTDQLRAHRCILALMSPVFHSMFSSEMKEQKSSVVHIEDMSIDALRAFLHLLYCGWVDRELFAVHGMEILQASDKYDVAWMKTACLSFLKDSIDCANCLQLLECARMYDDKDLECSCNAFISSNFRLLILSDHFESALRGSPELVVGVIRNYVAPEGAKHFKVQFRRHNAKTTTAHNIILYKNGTVKGLIDEIKRLEHLPESATVEILDIASHRIKKIYHSIDELTEIHEKVVAQEISVAYSPGYTLALCHFYYDTNNSIKMFNEPFLMYADPEETMSSVKKRIVGLMDNMDNTDQEEHHRWELVRLSAVSNQVEGVAPDAMKASMFFQSRSFSKMVTLGIWHL